MEKRSAALRIAKWKARMQQEALSAAMERRLARATEKYATYTSAAVGIESQIRQVLESKAVSGVVIPSILIIFYLDFGRQCFRLQRELFTGPAGDQAAQLLKDAWVARGLDSGTCKAIAAIFGYVVT